MNIHSLTRRGADIDVVVDDESWSSVAPDITGRVKRAASLAFARGQTGRPASAIVILLSDDARLRALNRQHRGKDRPTNVLSFPAGAGQNHLGDIAIAYGVTRCEAGAAGKPLLDHLLHLTVHGVLHLLGYDHERPSEADRMEALEREILAELGIPDPYDAPDRDDRG